MGEKQDQRFRPFRLRRPFNRALAGGSIHRETTDQEGVRSYRLVREVREHGEELPCRRKLDNNGRLKGDGSSFVRGTAGQGFLRTNS